MAKLNAVRGSQWPLVATFEASFGDTMVATDGVEKALFTTGGVFDALHLPQNSVVVGGEVIVDVVSNDGGTATVTIGDATTANRYGNTIDLKAAARTALTLTGFLNDIGRDIRLTIANNTGDATTGKFRVNVMYIIKDRVNEVQTH